MSNVKAIGWVTDFHIVDGAIVPTLSIATVDPVATDAGVLGPAVAVDADREDGNAALLQFIRDYVATTMSVVFGEDDGVRLVWGLDLVP